MKNSSTDRKIPRVLRAAVTGIMLVPTVPILATSFLIIYIRIRYRGAGSGKSDHLDAALRYNPRVQTMSEAMEILKAIPFRKTLPGPLARFAHWMIETVPSAMGEIRALAGLVYPYTEDFEPVIVESRDGTPLSGTLGMQPGEERRPALLFVHGLCGSKNAFNIQSLALRAYYDWGFHVCAMDLRNFGDSSRFSEAPTSWGYRESDDVLAVAGYLQSMARVTTVGVCGVSMGGASALIAAARSGLNRPLAGGVVALNCYADARRALGMLSSRKSLSPKSLAAWLTRRLRTSFKTFTGGPRPVGDLRSYTREVAAQYYEMSEEELYSKASPVNSIRDAEVPCLIIHSLDDRAVSVSEAYDLLAACVNNPMVDALIVPSGGHAIYQLTSPSWFNKTLETFFSYWARFGMEGGQYTGSSGTDTIGTFDNPNN